jgi:hypothetical protein
MEAAGFLKLSPPTYRSNIANNCHDSLKSYIGGGRAKVARDLHAFPLHTEDVSVIPVCVCKNILYVI